MREGQTPAAVVARVLTALEPLLEAQAPDAILVQGDTTTAFGGGVAGFYRCIPVGHVEAGLRSGDPQSPFPEEMNRRLITRLAHWHFAATGANVATLRAEGVAEDAIFHTGNPVVDSLQRVRAKSAVGASMRALLEEVGERRLLVLTTHRRESFGEVMSGNLQVLRDFIEQDNATDIQIEVPVLLRQRQAVPEEFLLPALVFPHVGDDQLRFRKGSCQATPRRPTGRHSQSGRAHRRVPPTG